MRRLVALLVIVPAVLVGCGNSEDDKPLPPSPGAERIQGAGGADNGAAPKAAEGQTSSEQIK